MTGTHHNIAPSELHPNYPHDQQNLWKFVIAW